MSSETIWTRIRQRPFEPFRLNTSAGKSFDIMHPEMIHLSKNRVIVAIYDKGEKPGEDIPSRDAFISPLHVASLEDLPRGRKRTGTR
jgi:hypothetical protein